MDSCKEKAGGVKDGMVLVLLGLVRKNGDLKFFFWPAVESGWVCF